MKITLKLSADVAEVLAHAMLQVQLAQGGHALLLFYVLFEINMKLRKN